MSAPRAILLRGVKIYPNILFARSFVRENKLNTMGMVRNNWNAVTMCFAILNREKRILSICLVSMMWNFRMVRFLKCFAP